MRRNEYLNRTYTKIFAKDVQKLPKNINSKKNITQF